MKRTMKADSPLPALMIVDDEDDDVALFARLLKRAGIKNPVLHFRDGGSAFLFLKRFCEGRQGVAPFPAAVFLDVNMQGLSGFDVLLWARRQAALEGLKIYMLSGASEIWDAPIATQLGADGFLEKFPSPAAIRDLLAPVCDLPAGAELA